MDSSSQAALLRIQNMMLLCQQLKLPVQFKVSVPPERVLPCLFCCCCALLLLLLMTGFHIVHHPSLNRCEGFVPLCMLQRLNRLILLYRCFGLQVSTIERQPAGTTATQTVAHATAEADANVQQPADHAVIESAIDAAQLEGETRELAVVVHVLSDYAFKKYLQHCSASDLLLLRGLLLKVRPVENNSRRQTVHSTLMLAVLYEHGGLSGLLGQEEHSTQCPAADDAPKQLLLYPCM
jgi:hypothetical protein